MKGIESQVLDWTRRQALVSAGDVVLVALSGGADSVCLLRILLALRDRLEIQVCGAHYNHKLRGAESDSDEAFAENLCTTLGVPFVVGVGDVAAEAKRTGRSIEATAREMRYAFLAKATEELGATKIATGHHADDNAETVLLHLIRGTGLRGLAGIPPKRGNIIRPILPHSRREIVDYLADLGQDFVEDRTNQGVTLRRNALRHQVLPVLWAQNPNLAATITRETEILRRDAQFLDALAAETFDKLLQDEAEICLSAKELTALDPAIAARVAALAVSAADGEAEEIHIRQVLDIASGVDPSAETMVPGITVRREYDRLIFAPSSAPSEGFAPMELSWETPVLLPEMGLRITMTRENVGKGEKVHTFFFQSVAVCGKITLRPRQAGDKIRLAASNGTKTLKKLMIEKKIPAGQRNAWPVFSDEAGVIAVYGLGIAQRVAPEPGDEMIRIVVEELPCIEI